jgi:hypothetical protein
MFETQHQPLATTSQFIFRVTRCTLYGLLFLACAVSLGMWGFRLLEHMSWIDAFTNAALTLADMGLVVPVTTSAGKIFTGIYALLSGLVFFSFAGIIFAPIIHRLFHRFHLDG